MLSSAEPDDDHHHHHHVDALITATDALHFERDADHNGDNIDNDDFAYHHEYHLDHPYGSHQPSPMRPSRRPPPPAQAEHEARIRCRRQHYPKAADFRLGLDDDDHNGDTASVLSRPTTELWLPEEAMAAEAQLNHFQHSKQHTGMKNMSFNVTAAVAPAPTTAAAAAATTNAAAPPHVRYAPAKTFVDAKPPQRQQQQSPLTNGDGGNGGGVMPAYRPVANQLCESAQIAEAQRQQQQRQAKAEAVLPDGVTEQGYFDLKFYHNKLW